MIFKNAVLYWSLDDLNTGDKLRICIYHSKPMGHISLLMLQESISPCGILQFDSGTLSLTQIVWPCFRANSPSVILRGNSPCYHQQGSKQFPPDCKEHDTSSNLSVQTGLLPLLFHLNIYIVYSKIPAEKFPPLPLFLEFR